MRDEDLAGLARGFVGAPFLRNHDEEDIESRDGTVIASGLQAGADGVTELRQRIRLTTQRDRQALAEGQIDRFSIAFDVAGWKCSICGEDWLQCDHWPGRSYLAGGRSLLCELVAEQPLAREVSAVNVPAVDGTGLLVDLCACKEQLDEREEDKMPVLSMTKGDEVVGEKGILTQRRGGGRSSGRKIPKRRGAEERGVRRGREGRGQAGEACCSASSASSRRLCVELPYFWVGVSRNGVAAA